MSFEPQLSALPAAQQALWPQLKQLPPRFILYGGTALALRLAHRQSEDFDFFTDAPVAAEELLHSVPFLAKATVRQQAPNTLTVTVHTSGPVKLSFSGLTLRRVCEPDPTSDHVIRVASLLDTAGCKMAVIQSRSEAKDYLDIYALLQHGVRPADMLAAGRAIYGERFNPMISLKAMTWFKDGDLGTLPETVKQLLISAAARVTDIPELPPRPGGLVPPGEA